MSINVSSRKLERSFSLRFGTEDHPVLIVDDFYPDPLSLLELAARRDQFTSSSDDFYPGVKLDLRSKAYFSALKGLESKLGDVFALNDSRMQLGMSCFAISNTPQSRLLPIQCVPHFDTPDQHQLAAVHYLCDEACGGTSFYRHHATDYEEISSHRVLHYQTVLGRQATTHGLPSAEYIRGDTELFSKIGSVKARFNRIVIYRSSVLHSGDLEHLRPDSGMLPDARLTITSNLVFNSNHSPVTGFK